VLFTFSGTVATLEGGAAQTLELRHPDDARDAARGERVDVGRRGVRLRAPLLRLAEPGGPEVLADVFFVGASPVVADRRDVASEDVVRVNGFRTPPGRMLRLEAGDWLQVMAHGGGRGGSAAPAPSREAPSAARTYLVETGERARTASFVRVRNDRVERLYPARRLEPLLRSFGQAMDVSLQGIPGAGEDGGAEIVRADVRLTLDRELGDALDRELARWCAERAHPTRPRAASLLVMDAFSGSVRAMPSCPGEEELAPFEPLSTRTRERFLRNQNLAPHPVGSAAKPFWSAAVATTYPNLLDLRIPAHAAGETDSVLGCGIEAPYADGHGSEGATGFETFLQRSCNRYQVELATLALAAGAGRGDACRRPMAAEAFARDCLPGRPGVGVEAAATGHRVCDALVATVLAPGLEVVGGSCRDLQLVDARFAPGPALASLTNVATYRDPSPGLWAEAGSPGLSEQYRSGRYRTDVWRDVLRQIEAAGDTVHDVTTALRFAGASPQAANLALNTVEELREDWVNLLLGGENSRWSNYELAEATSRLVTGRVVQGRFADRVGTIGPEGGATGDAGGFPLLPPGDLHAGVRRRVLHAMELAARPGGTAGRLEGALAGLRERLARGGPAGGGYDLYAFAKTGTPTVEKFVSSAQQRLVERLVADGSLSWDGGRFRLEPRREEEIRRTLGAGALRWLLDDVLRPIERDPEAFRERAGSRLPAHPVYLTAGGRVAARELADLRVDRQGGVLVLGLLAVPKDQGRQASAALDAWVSACPDPELRRRILEVPPAERLDPSRSVGVSVAIYLDDLPPGEGSGSAVELATRVLDELGVYVEDEVRRRAVGG